jgi:hypothetical protein
MKKLLALIGFVLAITSAAYAQDEGTVEVKDRFERDKTVYFSFGPAFTLGENLGDYSTGLNFESGFLKRSNRLLSWGPSLSYLGFAYDDSKTYPYYYDPENDQAYELDQDGGNVNIISLGLNLKLNFIPVSDNTVFSIYGIVNPFVSFVYRKEVIQKASMYVDEDEVTGEYDGVYKTFVGNVIYSPKNYPSLASENKISGGAHLGFGLEFMPAKKISAFLQATFSYTLPITYISTESFLKAEDQYEDENNTIYYDAYKTLFLDDFPIVKEGFSAVSIKVGMAFNF